VGGFGLSTVLFGLLLLLPTFLLDVLGLRLGLLSSLAGIGGVALRVSVDGTLRDGSLGVVLD
jgi:hypothetical protein